jgi:hypothetical protein
MPPVEHRFKRSAERAEALIEVQKHVAALLGTPTNIELLEQRSRSAPPPPRA